MRTASMQTTKFNYFRPSFSLHYSAVKPLKMVYGRGQYLYDEQDQPYLDCINNVTHGTPPCHVAVRRNPLAHTKHGGVC